MYSIIDENIQEDSQELAKVEKSPELPELNQRQLEWIKNYTDKNNKDTYDNATKSYLKAYMDDRYQSLDNVLAENPSLYQQANREVMKLKKTPSIQARLDYILDMQGFNDFSVDTEHLKLIKQDSDKSTKLNAIKHYDKKKWRIKEWVHAGNIQINQIFAQVMGKKDNIIGNE